MQQVEILVQFQRWTVGLASLQSLALDQMSSKSSRYQGTWVLLRKCHSSIATSQIGNLSSWIFFTTSGEDLLLSFLKRAASLLKRQSETYLRSNNWEAPKDWLRHRLSFHGSLWSSTWYTRSSMPSAFAKQNYAIANSSSATSLFMQRFPWF